MGNRYRFRMNAAGGGGPTYLTNEGFEGTGVPSGWTTNAGTPDYDYTTSPLRDAQSLRVFGASDAVVSSVFASQTTVEVRIAFRIAALPVTTNTNLITASDGTNNAFRVLIAASGTLSVTTYNGATGTGQGSTASSISAATDYVLWVRYVKGTGANGFISIAWETKASGVRPTSGNQFVSSSTATNTNNIVATVFDNVLSSETRDKVIDDVKVVGGSDTLGNYP